MDMLTDGQIAEANLTDWHELAQGFHARNAVGDGHSDLKLISDDARFR